MRHNLGHYNGHVRNKYMLLLKKSSLWGCYNPRHVTIGDVPLLVTIQYVQSIRIFYNPTDINVHLQHSNIYLHFFCKA